MPPSETPEKVTTEKVTTIENSAPQVVKTTTHVTPAVQGEPPQKAFEQKKKIFRTYQVIWYILGVIEVLLIFRIILKILGANQNSNFANVINLISDPLTLPFNGLFPIEVTEGSVFEWSALIAGVVYLIVAFGLMELMQLIKPTTPGEVEASV